MKKIVALLVLNLSIVGSVVAQENNTHEKFTIGVEAATINQPNSNINLSGYSPATIFGGINLNEHLFLGGEIGLNYFFSSQLMPISAKLKWRPLNTKLSPYASCNIGYNIFIANTEEECRYLGSESYNPGVYSGGVVKFELGLDLKISSHSAIHAGVSANNQSVMIETGNLALNSTQYLHVILLAYKVGYSYSF